MARLYRLRPMCIQAKRAGRYRSQFEKAIADELERTKVPYSYETMKVEYVIPATDHKYTPDFILTNGIIVEAKGEFDKKCRKKHRLIQEQHPKLDIRFVFSNPNQKIYTGSKTSYAQWCKRYKFKWAKKFIPKEWIEE